MASCAALAFAGDGVAFRRVEVGQLDVALEGCLDRSDFEADLGLKLSIGMLGQLLAAGNAVLQNIRIVQGREDDVTRGL